MFDLQRINFDMRLGHLFNLLLRELFHLLVYEIQILIKTKVLMVSSFLQLEETDIGIHSVVFILEKLTINSKLQA